MKIISSYQREKVLSAIHYKVSDMTIYSTVQLKLVGGRGNEMKGKANSRLRRIPFPFFSPEISTVFTVATGEIRGIRFPQEGNAFFTWENE